MACGLPAITNVRGESAEAVSGARAGIACRPDGVAEAVEQLSAVPARQRRAMGERGRAFVEAHKSRTAMAGRLRELLEEVVK
jgi:glycosyltransferase involved in cell wall biosynthesis